MIAVGPPLRGVRPHTVSAMGGRHRGAVQGAARGRLLSDDGRRDRACHGVLDVFWATLESELRSADGTDGRGQGTDALSKVDGRARPSDACARSAWEAEHTDTRVSIHTEGRAHGAQKTSTQSRPKKEGHDLFDCKAPVLSLIWKCGSARPPGGQMHTWVGPGTWRRRTSVARQYLA